MRTFAWLPMVPRSGSALRSLASRCPWALLIAFLAYLVLGHWYARHNYLNVDEAFYAAASARAMSGELPYRDFAYTQTPLLPYVNGPFLELDGYSLRGQRLLNLAWGAGALAALVALVRRHSGSWKLGGVAALVLVSCPYWVAQQGVGKTYAAAGCFLMIAGWAALSRGRFVPRTLCLAFFGTLAVGCRLPCILPFGALVLLHASSVRGAWLRVTALLAPVAALVLLLGPFLAASPENARFFLWDYHLASRIGGRALHQVTAWFRVGLPVLVALGAGLATLSARRVIRGEQRSAVALAAVGVVTVLTPLAKEGSHGEYLVPFLPLAIAVGAMLVWDAGAARREVLARMAWLAPLLAVAHKLPSSVGHDACRSSEEVAERLRQLPEGEVLSPMPSLAYAAGRQPLPGTTMGAFSTLASGEEDRARVLNMTSPKLIVNALEERRLSAVVVITPYPRWNFGWQLPELRDHPSEDIEAMQRSLDRHYEVDRTYGGFIVYRAKPPWRKVNDAFRFR